MEFLNKKYNFYGMDDEIDFVFTITKDDINNKLIAKIYKFIIFIKKKISLLETEVIIDSDMNIESSIINISQDQNISWKLNEKIVNKFKIKCKFDGVKISSSSTIFVIHNNSNEWVDYPMTSLGYITIK